MKCPKCGYLGFDSGDRCRNCGYDFSLIELPELPLADPGPRTSDSGSARGPREESESSSATARADGGGAPSVVSNADDLPLLPGFDEPDLKLVQSARQPRAPLAVRRSTPEIPRLRSEPPRTPSSLAFRFGQEVAREEPAPAAAVRTAATQASEPARAAGASRRLIAIAIDLLLLAGADLTVLYFTLRICGLTVAQISVLPIVPLVGFYLVLDGGYFAAFTAGGQTIGKMAAGIRVVGDDEPLSPGRAIVRTMIWALSAIPAGLGFLSILTNADHRGLHDRFAGTRVVAAR